MEFLQKCGLIYPSLIYSYKFFIKKKGLVCKVQKFICIVIKFPILSVLCLTKLNKNH